MSNLIVLGVKYRVSSWVVADDDETNCGKSTPYDIVDDMTDPGRIVYLSGFTSFNCPARTSLGKVSGHACQLHQLTPQPCHVVPLPAQCSFIVSSSVAISSVSDSRFN